MKTLSLTYQEAQLLVRHAIISGQITPAANAGYNVLAETQRARQRECMRKLRQRRLNMGLTSAGAVRKIALRARFDGWTEKQIAQHKRAMTREGMRRRRAHRHGESAADRRKQRTIA